MWVWVGVGLGVFVLAVVVGVVRILGVIGREVFELHETTMWADWPTSSDRMSAESADVPSFQGKTKAPRAGIVLLTASTKGGDAGVDVG
jgi:hypothetical protein